MTAVLKVEHLHKEYPGVIAVKDMSFELHRGEVLALLGENGAGKSTMSKMICGIEKPDRGSIYVDGKEVKFKSAMDARNEGITMVHQELTMVPEMTVAENVFMNRQPVNSFGHVNWKELYKDTEKLLGQFKLDIRPQELVKHLTVGTQQLLEIIRATSMDSKIIILDEPTSSLADSQIELMFENVERLKKEGYAFIYISHKLDEIFRIADKVVVMRDGTYVGEEKISDLDQDKIITMMVGRKIEQLFGTEERVYFDEPGYEFEVENLSSGDMYQNVSFGVKKGEILGVAGLIGAGRSEMALGIFGCHKHTGTVKLNGQKVDIEKPADAIKNGIAYITEDRKNIGLYLEYSIKTNLAVMKMKEFSKAGRIQENLVKRYAEDQIKKFQVATPSKDQIMGYMSGGNQQKCLLAMWMGLNPKVLIIDEPTKGVDVGAKSEIYQMIKQHANEGNSVIVISSELTELLGICDRIMVMHEGTVTGEVEKKDFSEDRIMQFATGMN